MRGGRGSAEIALRSTRGTPAGARASNGKIPHRAWGPHSLVLSITSTTSPAFADLLHLLQRRSAIFDCSPQEDQGREEEQGREQDGRRGRGEHGRDLAA